MGIGGDGPGTIMLVALYKHDLKFRKSMTYEKWDYCTLGYKNNENRQPIFRINDKYKNVRKYVEDKNGIQKRDHRSHSSELHTKRWFEAMKVDKVLRGVYKRKNRATTDFQGVYVFRWQKEEMKLDGEARKLTE